MQKLTVGKNKEKTVPMYSYRKKNGYILGALVKKNFKAQYRNSILGVLWTVLNPLLNMVVLTLVFSNLFKMEGVCYPVYLFCGNLIFNMLRQITTQSLGCLVDNSELIKKVKISYSVFPISNMFTALTNFGFAFLSLLVVMLVLKQPFYWTILLTVTIIPAVMLFSLGVGFVLSSLFVFFRDVRHLYEVFITLWMYLTPIFYTATSLNNVQIQKIIMLNPMTQYITMFRDVIQMGVVPNWQTYLICYCWAFALLLIGYAIFKLNKKKYILYI